MDGFTVAQQGHVCAVWAPIDITGGITGKWISLRNHKHVTFIIQIGVSAAAPTAILVKAAQDNAGTGAVAIPYNLFTQETTDGDVLSTKTALASTGYTTITANDRVFYVIELDAKELLTAAGANFPFVTINITNGANSVIASCVAVLSGARYEVDQSATALS
jgi:hypothetical protein